MSFEIARNGMSVSIEIGLGERGFVPAHLCVRASTTPVERMSCHTREQFLLNSGRGVDG